MKLRSLLLPLAIALPAWNATSDNFGIPPITGPVAPVWANVLWVRTELALEDRRLDRALAFAERAVRAHPGETGGWRRLVALYLLQPSALEADRRLAAIDRGLELAERGTERCRDPGALTESVITFLRGRASAEESAEMTRELLARATRFEAQFGAQDPVSPP